MKVTLINPNIVSQKGDLFGSGIPYFPLSLGYTAAYLRSKKINVEIIDSFGLAPKKVREIDGYFYQGLTEIEVVEQIKDTELIGIYSGLVVSHNYVISLVQKLRKKTKIPIAIIGNQHSVNAYALELYKNDFFKAGADFLIIENAEQGFFELCKCILKKEFKNIFGVVSKKKFKKEATLEKIKIEDLPFPAWDLFPLNNYWDLSYSHGPLSSKKYLPLLTSRGCPNRCEFCVVPHTNKHKWAGRNPKNIVEEVIYFKEKFGVTEFHIEDLNPTADILRIKQFAQILIDKKINIVWKFAAGTKAETIDESALKIMGKAGLKYLSISPESGSEFVLKKMNKKFDFKHGKKIIKLANTLKIPSQACFVIGFPGETKKDLNLTKKYMIELTKNGVDEVALFIMSPLPGAKVFQTYYQKSLKLNQLTFSPKWRSEYSMLNKTRLKFYLWFLVYKAIFHPIKLFKQPFSFFTKKFYNKSEMIIYRVFKVWNWAKQSKRQESL